MAIFSFGHKRVKQRCSTSATDNNKLSDSDSNGRNRRSSYKFRNWLGLQQLQLHDHKSRSSIPVHEFLSRARNDESDCYPKSYRGYQRNRHNKYLYPVKTLCLSVLTAVVTAPAHAADVGGVSATANPIANSSGSVTNQAIQVLQGPYITNTYGGGISCQGPTANFTPYITHARNDKDPFETFYMEPQYDNRDFEGRMVEVTKNVKNWPWESWYDDRTYTNADGDTVRAYEDGQDMTITVMEMQGDGVPDNPGQQLWQKPVRTGMSRNYSTSVGLSATLSLPLDSSLQDKCKEAAETQIALQGQMLANKRLDFELARLKNCGELLQKGIQFHPRSPYAKVCADVVVMNKTAIAPHVHSIPPTSSKVEQSATSSQPDSSDAVQQSSQTSIVPGSSYPVRSQSSSLPSSQSVSQPLTTDQQEALRAVRNSSLPQQWRR